MGSNLYESWALMYSKLPRSKLAIAMQFWPNLIDEKLLVLEKMPSEPKFLKIPEYRPPSDLKHTPAFQVHFLITHDITKLV